MYPTLRIFKNLSLPYIAIDDLVSGTCLAVGYLLCLQMYISSSVIHALSFVRRSILRERPRQ